MMFSPPLRQLMFADRGMRAGTLVITTDIANVTLMPLRHADAISRAIADAFFVITIFAAFAVTPARFDVTDIVAAAAMMLISREYHRCHRFYADFADYCRR